MTGAPFFAIVTGRGPTASWFLLVCLFGGVFMPITITFLTTDTVVIDSDSLTETLESSLLRVESYAHYSLVIQVFVGVVVMGLLTLLFLRVRV